MISTNAIRMNSSLRRRAGSALIFGLAGFAGSAATAAEPVPQGVLQLSATATQEAPQDWMRLQLQVTREGADPVAVQSQLKQALDAALAEARKVAKPGQVELQTNGMSVSPRYGQKGTITGWQGRGELLVEGRDMAAISQLSGKVGSMTVGQISYSLSREAREKLEADVTAQAIARFRARAADQAKLFGYAGFELREVSVNSDASTESVQPSFRGKAMLASAPMADGVPMPVEAGKGTVTTTVSGSVQLK